MATQVNSRQRSAVWGGVLLSILGNLSWQDVTHTIILGAIGTVVSYFVSALLKFLSRKYKR